MGAPTVAEGRFIVHSRVGEGGQAVVLRVTDRRLQAERALKVLTPGMAEKLKIRARFVDEARAMASLDHPNIVRVYDVDTDEALPFMVMEYLPGGSLVGWLERYGSFPPRQAVAITLQVCAGAAAAHAVGIIHRDLKPHNVLVAADGTCKVTDFGIARTGQGARTMTGAALGTLGYMAPEQSRDAANVDPRADVFSIGMTLVVLLTGRDPQDWVAGELSDAIHPLLLPVLTRATAHRPERRHGSAEELAASLAAVAERLPPDVLRVPLGALPRVDDPQPDLTEIAVLLDGRRPTGDPDRAAASRPAPPAPATRRATPTPSPSRRVTPTGPTRPGTPAPVGRRATPGDATPTADPPWLERPPEAHRGFVVTLDDKEREESRRARERRAAAQKTSASADAVVAPLVDDLVQGPVGELRGFVGQVVAAVVGGLLALGVAPLIAVAAIAAVLVYFGKTSWEERAATSALSESRSALEATIGDHRDVLDALAREGARGNELLALYASWENARGDERTRAALLLVDAIDREADRLGVAGDDVGALVQARDDYRRAAAEVESLQD